MTETELNEQLALLSGTPGKEGRRPAPGQRRSGRCYRRRKGLEKSNRRLAIVQRPGYTPHLGYVDRHVTGKTLLHTGAHIKYPRDSSCQRWLKRVSSKKVRACPHLPKKGNGYRRVFDYWWSLY